MKTELHNDRLEMLEENGETNETYGRLELKLRLLRCFKNS